jgi:hypothetical protein
MIQRHILPLWGRAKLTEITREDVQEFQAWMVAEGFKPGSVNRYMALGKYIFNLAEKWEVIDKNPARGVSRVADNSRKERYLTREETARLLAVLKDWPNRTMADLIRFLILTADSNLRITLSQRGPDNSTVEAGTLIVPASQANNFVNGLAGSLKELDDRLKKAREEQAEMPWLHSGLFLWA